MKKLLLVALMCCCGYLHAQNLPPVAIEDKKMDGYLAVRKPATLTIQVKNLPDSVKKVNIKYTLVQFGVSVQVTKYAETNAAGLSKITLDENLPYQQIWLNVGDYLYAGIYVNSGLTVNVDAQKIPKDGIFMIGDGVTYSGSDGSLNTVMNENVLFRKKEKEDIENNLRTLCSTRKQYTAYVFGFKTDSILKLMNSIDNE